MEAKELAQRRRKEVSLQAQQDARGDIVARDSMAIARCTTRASSPEEPTSRTSDAARVVRRPFARIHYTTETSTTHEAARFTPEVRSSALRSRGTTRPVGLARAGGSGRTSNLPRRPFAKRCSTLWVVSALAATVRARLGYPGRWVEGDGGSRITTSCAPHDPGAEGIGFGTKSGRSRAANGDS